MIPNLLDIANDLHKRLRAAEMLPVNTRFIKLRYDPDGTFTGIQVESMAMSSYEAAQLKPKTDKTKEKATV